MLAAKVLTGNPLWLEKTVLAALKLFDFNPLLVLPSFGDCSYPGLFYHEGELGSATIQVTKMIALRFISPNLKCLISPGPKKNRPVPEKNPCPCRCRCPCPINIVSRIAVDVFRARARVFFSIRGHALSFFLLFLPDLKFLRFRNTARPRCLLFLFQESSMVL